MPHCMIWALALPLLTLAGAAFGANPDDIFEQLYGPQLKSASTPARKTQLAAKLMSDAAKLTDDKPFQRVVYSKIYDLTATEPQGYGLALGAAEQLKRLDPDGRTGADDKIAAVLERECRNGAPAGRRIAASRYIDIALSAAQPKIEAGETDQALAVLQKASSYIPLAGRMAAGELQSELNTLHEQQTAAKRVADLRAKIDAEPNDSKTATELVRLLLYELNQPGQAVIFVDRTGDPGTSRAVRLAAQDPSKLSDDQMLTLADWYHAQAAKLAGDERTAALARTAQLYRMFIATHGKEDSSSLKARTLLSTTMRDLDREPGSGPLHVVDLLALIDPARDAVAGPWKFDATGLTGAPGDSSRLAVPFQPPPEYDLELSFDKPNGSSIILVFSQGNRSLAWVIGAWDGVTSGFELINGKNAKDNLTAISLPQTLRAGSHTVSIRVRSYEVAALLDGKTLDEYEFQGETWSLGSYAAVGGYPLGLAVGRTADRAVFRSFRLTEARDRGRELKHPK